MHAYPDNITERKIPSPKRYFERVKKEFKGFFSIQGKPEASGQEGKVEIIIARAPALEMLTPSEIAWREDTAITR